MTRSPSRPTEGGRAGTFARDERGVVAIVVALSAATLVGASAVAVDLSHYRMNQNRLQSAADAGALAAVQMLDTPDLIVPRAVEFAMRNVPESYGVVLGPQDVELGEYNRATGVFTPTPGPDWSAVRVTTERSPARANAAPQLLSVIFGGDDVTIRASAVAARNVRVFYEPPSRINLPPDAGDFNEIYAYCFDYEGTGTPESRRSQMTLISNNDNAQGTAVSQSGGRVTAPPAQVEWPRCEEGESLSFRMRNIRHVKSHPVLWDNPNASIGGRQIGRPEWNYFTDTRIVSGVEVFTGLNEPILETVRCDSPNCERELADGTIPRGRNRTPTIDPRPCMPGNYMYFGWEDRPPGRSGASASWTDPAWTDRDYDDIVIVMRCPESGMLGSRTARLVR